MILSQTGPWYVDGATGRGRPDPAAAAGGPRSAGPGRHRPAPPPPTPSPGRAPRRARHRRAARSRRVLRLGRMECPDEFGRLQRMDVLTLDFDYGGAAATFDDERQFLRVRRHSSSAATRRPRPPRWTPCARMASCRCAWPTRPPPRDAACSCSAAGRPARAGSAFVAERMPELESLGWRSVIDRDFGPRPGRTGRRLRRSHRRRALRAGSRWNSASRSTACARPLLPILNHLLARGGIDAAQIVDGR